MSLRDGTVLQDVKDPSERPRKANGMPIGQVMKTQPLAYSSQWKVLCFSGILLICILFVYGAKKKTKAKTKTHSPKATLVLFNGKFTTMDPKRPKAQAIAIRKHLILAVGSDQSMQKWIGPKTKKLNLHGKRVTPGLIDAHVHLLSLGLTRMRLNLAGTKSAKAIIKKVQERIAKSKPGEWIIGRGWDQNHWKKKRFPHHKSLSKISPKNPVILVRIDGHAVWVNALALRLASISDQTENPKGGQIIRSKDGKATGILIDTAIGLVQRKIPKGNRAKYKLALQMAIQESISYGLTSVHDAGVNASTVGLFKDLLKEGRLPLRVYLMLSGGDKTLLKRYLAKGPDLHLGKGHLTIRSIKMMVDGALGSRGAALLKPYHDSPKKTGLVITSEKKLLQMSKRALKSGFQVCTHAIGDKGNRITLNAYEKAFKALPQKQNPRFRIEHAQIIHPTDIPRFFKLGVIPSMQATHCTSDMNWVHIRIGKKRAQAGAYVWQSLLRSGARIANGSDAPVESINPLLGFYAAITRQDHKGQPKGGWYPGQRMTRLQALRSFTLDAAYAAFEEKYKGSLTPGKWADLTVFTKDIMQIPAKDILTTKIQHTMIGGKFVYSLKNTSSKPAVK